MPNEPRWLPVEAVISSNRALVAATGEPHFVRDRGLLEGAVARPQNLYAYGETDVVALAARLMIGIAQAHPFEQGNKRTAFNALKLFLQINSYDLAVGDTEPWAQAVVALVERQLDEASFIHRIRPFVVPIG